MGYWPEKIKDLSVNQRDYLAGCGYMAEGLLGSGAFGKVYRVWDTKKKCFFACKISSGLDAKEILRREAEFQRNLKHSLFVRYENFLVNKECAMLLMEYVEGENLKQFLKDKDLTQAQVVNMAVQLAEGLEYLHGLSTPVYIGI